MTRLHANCHQWQLHLTIQIDKKQSTSAAYRKPSKFMLGLGEVITQKYI